MELIDRQHRELLRVESKIAEIERAPWSARLAAACLLDALRAEHLELSRALGRKRKGPTPTVSTVTRSA
jgi:hypothetical protein